MLFPFWCVHRMLYLWSRPSAFWESDCISQKASISMCSSASCNICASGTPSDTNEITEKRKIQKHESTSRDHSQTRSDVFDENANILRLGNIQEDYRDDRDTQPEQQVDSSVMAHLSTIGLGYASLIGSALPALRRFLKVLDDKGYKWEYLLKALSSMADAVFNPEEEDLHKSSDLPIPQV